MKNIPPHFSTVIHALLGKGTKYENNKVHWLALINIHNMDYT